MKAKHLLAIGLIFLGTLIAWMILGAATTERTDSSYSSLKGEVASLYGGDLIFRTPLCFRNVERITTTWEEGREVQTSILEPVEREALESRVAIHISLDRRKRGNLWFPTFRTRFVGEYLFRVDDLEETWYLYSALESSNSIYSHIAMAVNGRMAARPRFQVPSCPYTRMLIKATAKGRWGKILVSPSLNPRVR